MHHRDRHRHRTCHDYGRNERISKRRRTNARQAWYLAFYEVEGVKDDFPTRYRAAVEQVTADDVLRVARSYLA